MNTNNLSHGNILIVDDLPENLTLLSEMMSNQGYYVRPVPSGKLALQAATAIPPDLILLDINMPEIDGFEVCKRLKANEKTQDIPIIFLSANSDTETIVKGLELGASDYITKPFQAAEVLSRVKTHLELSLSRKLIALKNHKQRKLIHVLCHDLQNSLGAIRNFLDLLDEDSLEEFKELLIESADNGIEIIQFVRQLSSLTDGKLKLSLKEHLLKNLIEQATSLLQTKFSQKNITPVIHISKDIKVNVDSISFINSVIINLLTNAIKFSYPNSEIIINAQETSENVTISIEDFGIGMSETLCADVFKEDKPTARAGTNGEAGTGYGMPLVKEFVVTYGGNIEVFSQEKTSVNLRHGTKVIISLPNINS